MTNWTDPIIHWNQLPGTEVKRLLATWGMDEKAIARYDAKHGFAPTPLKVPAPAKAVATKPVVTAVPKAPAKKASKDISDAVRTSMSRTKDIVKRAARQKHTGADGEVKFVEHRSLYVGFWGGKVVVTKRTEAACREFLAKVNAT
jgi:hypothetical protein